jgi:hypothetical protein
LNKQLTNNTNSVIANKTNTDTIMATTLVEHTYSHLATLLATSAKQIAFLEAERVRVASLYPTQDVDEDTLVSFVGGKLIAELDNAIRSLKACLEPVTEQLGQKLAEPVEEQLGLGLWKTEPALV